MFSAYENIFATKIKRITVHETPLAHSLALRCVKAASQRITLEREELFSVYWTQEA